MFFLYFSGECTRLALIRRHAIGIRDVSEAEFLCVYCAKCLPSVIFSFDLREIPDIFRINRKIRKSVIRAPEIEAGFHRPGPGERQSAARQLVAKRIGPDRKIVRIQMRGDIRKVLVGLVAQIRDKYAKVPFVIAIVQKPGYHVSCHLPASSRSLSYCPHTDRLWIHIRVKCGDQFKDSSHNKIIPRSANHSQCLSNGNRAGFLRSGGVTLEARFVSPGVRAHEGELWIANEASCQCQPGLEERRL